MGKARIIATLVIALGLGILTGCAGNQGLISSMRNSTRQDIFQEFAAVTPIPSDYADLRIVSSLKTHRPGIYSIKDIHGTPEYRLLINIDGQATQIPGDLREEITEKRGVRDPEAGEGIRYKFNKNLRLKAGTHKIVIAILEDEITVEREIILADGSSNTLVIEPVYRLARDKRRIGFYTTTSFKEGIKGFRVNLNGKSL